MMISIPKLVTSLLVLYLGYHCNIVNTHNVKDVAYDKVIMCYFGSWSTYRWASGHFDVEDIDPFLCTHLVFGFAGLDPDSYTIRALDPYNELEDNWGKGAYKRFTNLKKLNGSYPYDLKVIAAPCHMPNKFLQKLIYCLYARRP